MKIRKIYCAKSEITDMSKDRIHLDLSYSEWVKIRNLVDFVRWETDKPRLKKQAENINNMFKYANELKALWDDEK